MEITKINKTILIFKNINGINLKILLSKGNIFYIYGGVGWINLKELFIKTSEKNFKECFPD